MKVLLSIKPEFASKIFDGTKKFEYRKAVHKQKDVKTIAVYATRPVAKIIGEFDVSHVFEASPNDLWQKTQHASGITEEFFNLYFEGRDVAYAFAVGEIRKYDTPIEPSDVIDNFIAPQSYMYVSDCLSRCAEREKVSDKEQFELI
jgi:predicted transcriptional regulator